MGITIFTIIYSTAGVFYFIFPLLRFLLIQFYWAGIRKKLLKAARYPEIPFLSIQNRASQLFKFFGRYESMGDGAGFWVENSEQSLFLKGSSFPCFLLPTRAGRDGRRLGRYHPVSVQRIKSNDVEQVISTLSSPSVLAAGKILENESCLTLDPEIIVLYEGKSDRVFERSIDAASPRYSIISFSNIFIYISAIFFFLFYSFYLTTYLFYMIQGLVVITLSLACMPIFFFCPPSVFFLYLFRREDKKMRRNLYNINFNKLKGGNRGSAKKLYRNRYLSIGYSIILLTLLYVSSFLVPFMLINFFL